MWVQTFYIISKGMLYESIVLTVVTTIAPGAGTRASDAKNYVC